MLISEMIEKLIDKKVKKLSDTSENLLVKQLWANRNRIHRLVFDNGSAFDNRINQDRLKNND